MTAYPDLHTDRLRLRALGPADTEGYGELLADPDTYPFITDSGPVGRSQIPARLSRIQQAREEGHAIYWAIEFRDRFVGYIALHGPDDASPALSYAVSPAERRQGIGSEAIGAVQDFVRDRLAASELIARTHESNEASQALLHALGWRDLGVVDTREGRRREFRKPLA